MNGRDIMFRTKKSGSKMKFGMMIKVTIWDSVRGERAGMHTYL